VLQPAVLPITKNATTKARIALDITYFLLLEVRIYSVRPRGPLLRLFLSELKTREWSRKP